MNTPSHWLMTIVIAKIAERPGGLSGVLDNPPTESQLDRVTENATEILADQGSKKRKLPRWAMGLGSLAPDIPLYFLTFGGFFYFGRYLNWPAGKTAKHLFSNLFYNDPGWITVHNFFHSPTMLLILGLSTWFLRSKFPKFARWSMFFLAACALHSFVDILTHNDDGPLLFFPFNWTCRFSSPVSYWDTDHHGSAFMIFEGLLDLVLLAMLVRFWWRDRSSKAIEVK